ncbi:MAG: acyltransferase family protein [Acidimicrobiales bacterium]
MAATSTAAPDVAATGPEPGSLRSRNREVEGLRAVAALAVLVTHVSLNAMGNRGPFGGLLARLDVGVAVFFVLSGYLLYRPFARSLLRAEPRPRTRRYLRHRLLRIVPAYWVVVAASFLLPAVGGLVLPTTDFSAAAAGATSVPLRDLARFATFTQVYWRDSLAGPFPQAWTLATEMAFYLFLPVLAWAVARRNRGDRPARLRRQWLVLGALAAVAQLFRLAVVAWSAPYQPGAAANAYTQQLAWLPNHLDLFALGMALAVLRVELDDRGPGAGLAGRLDRRLAQRGAAGLCALGALAVLLLAGYGLGLSRTALAHGPVGEFARHGAYLVVAGLCVLPATFGRAGGGAVRAALRARPMQFLGRISYGIYLWQIWVIGRWVSSPLAPPEIAQASRHPAQQFNVAFWPTLAWTLAVTVVLAAATWYLVERPAMRYRDRPLGWFLGGLWAISLASFASRLWAIGTVTSRDPGNGDPFYYHAQANMLADRVGFGEPIQWLTEGRFVPSAIHPPLFTLWLTPASLLGARGYLSHKAMAALAGVLVVVVAGLLARRLAGPRAGLIAAGLTALYPNLLVIDGTLWPEGLYTALVGAALLFAYRWRDEPSARDAVLLGASVGLAVLARGEAIALLPFLCLPLVLGRARTGAPWVRHGALMAAVALGLVAPWTVRNLVQFAETVPISTNSEEVLFYANCDDTYRGPLIGYWSFNCQEEARRERVAQGLPADPPGDESERAAGWGELGREYAAAHRDRWPAVAVARFTRAWDLQHSDTTARALQFEGRPYDWSIRGLWAYRLLLAPALVGLVVLRRRRVAIWPLLSMLAVVSLTAVAVYGHVRFRTVGDLVVLVAAAVAFDAVIGRLRRPRPATPSP